MKGVKNKPYQTPAEMGQQETFQVIAPGGAAGQDFRQNGMALTRRQVGQVVLQ